MSCAGRRDEFYKGDDFCPIPGYVFRALALVNLVFIICISAAASIHVSRRWRRNETHTRRFWGCVSLLFGCILSTPVQVGRLFHGEHDRSLPAAVFGSLGCLMYGIASVGLGFSSIRDSLCLVHALKPKKVASWKSLLLKWGVALSAGFCVVCIAMFLILSVAKENWRKSLVIFMFMVNSTVDSVQISVCVKIVFEVNVVLRGLPKEAPRKIRRVLHHVKRGITSFVFVIGVKMTLTLLVVIWPEGWKISGFLYIYVSWPVIHMFTLITTLPFKVRPDKSTSGRTIKPESSYLQPGHVKNLISKGVLVRQAAMRAKEEWNSAVSTQDALNEFAGEPPGEQERTSVVAFQECDIASDPEDEPSIKEGPHSVLPASQNDLLTKQESFDAVHALHCNSMKLGSFLGTQLSLETGRGRGTQPPPVWERGLSLEFLEGFIRDFDVRGLTTEEVCNQYIKPETLSARCSVWEAVWMSSTTELDSEADLVGTTTCMVSHAWLYEFTVLVDIIRRFVRGSQGRGQSGPTEYFFLDMFAMNQHNLDAAKNRQAGYNHQEQQQIYDELLEELRKSVSTPGKVLLALDPWYHPIPLTRCWCLYEVYIARKENCSLIMYFSDKAEKEFLSDLQANEHALEDLFGRVDARHAQATIDTDREMILKNIDKFVGMNEFNAFIQDSLRSSLKMIAMRWWVSKI